VHEAYLRLVGDKAGASWDGRGGDRARVPLEEAELLAPEPREDVLALDEALTELAATDRAAANLVQHRCFGGLSIPDAAHVLGVSPRTAERLWTFARARLRERIQGAGQDHSPS
jgi:DNA-directed RNA polymerase specialized sigma24 family protein